MGGEQLGSVQVEDNVGERVTGFISLRECEEDINLKAKDLKAADLIQRINSFENQIHGRKEFQNELMVH